MIVSLPNVVSVFLSLNFDVDSIFQTFTGTTARIFPFLVLFSSKIIIFSYLLVDIEVRNFAVKSTKKFESEKIISQLLFPRTKIRRRFCFWHFQHAQRAVSAVKQLKPSFSSLVRFHFCLLYLELQCYFLLSYL